MVRLLLASILFVTLLLPVAVARQKNWRRAFGSLIFYVVVAEVGYGVFLYFIYPRLL